MIRYYNVLTLSSSSSSSTYCKSIIHNYTHKFYNHHILQRTIHHHHHVAQQQQQQLQSESKHIQLKLLKPTIVYQSNHLLVLYKPPGWHSIPNQNNNNMTVNHNNNNSNNSDITSNTSTATTTTTTTTTTNNNNTEKCLLSYCQTQKLGGGSNFTYIKPLHRIDQPCTGIILYSKTTKAASRIQSIFNKMSILNNNNNYYTNNNVPQGGKGSDKSNKESIQKIYYVMVRINNDSHNKNTHIDNIINNYSENGIWYTLQGMMVQPSSSSSTKSRNFSNNNHSTINKGWSVRFIPFHNNDENTNKDATGGVDDYDIDDKEVEQFRKPEFRKPEQEQTTKKQKHGNKLCTLQYRIVHTYHHPNDTFIRLLQIRTKQGARHMIRALLSCYHIHVMGDVRYDTSNHHIIEPLPDQSVALHAYSISMSKSILIKTKKIKSYRGGSGNVNVDHVDTNNITNEMIHNDSSDNNNNNQPNNVFDQHDHNNNNNNDDDDDYYFYAPVPKTWSQYFHCNQSMIDSYEQQYPNI